MPNSASTSAPTAKKSAAKAESRRFGGFGDAAGLGRFFFDGTGNKLRPSSSAGRTERAAQDSTRPSSRTTS